MSLQNDLSYDMLCYKYVILSVLSCLVCCCLAYFCNKMFHSYDFKKTKIEP